MFFSWSPPVDVYLSYIVETLQTLCSKAYERTSLLLVVLKSEQRGRGAAFLPRAQQVLVLRVQEGEGSIRDEPR